MKEDERKSWNCQNFWKSKTWKFSILNNNYQTSKNDENVEHLT
jgi:hypothetical protein